jgi:predicted TPR repeat methyltransferase
VGTYASLTMANVHFTAGRYPECVTSVRNVIEKSPEWLQGHAVLTAALGLAGDLTAAAEARDTLLRLRPDYSLTWTLKSHSRPPPAGGRVDQKDPMGVWLATGAL